MTLSLEIWTPMIQSSGNWDFIQMFFSYQDTTEL